MVVAPITCNSLAKWAAGISDTLPLGLLVEAIGKQQPVVALPFSNWAQISFPAIQQAMSTLGTWGVTILVGDDIYKQHEPGTGDNYVHLFPWHLAWRALLQHPWLDSGLLASTPNTATPVAVKRATGRLHRAGRDQDPRPPSR
jgi:hypothetical protein